MTTSTTKQATEPATTSQHNQDWSDGKTITTPPDERNNTTPSARKQGQQVIQIWVYVLSQTQGPRCQLVNDRHQHSTGPPVDFVSAGIGVGASTGTANGFCVRWQKEAGFCAPPHVCERSIVICLGCEPVCSPKVYRSPYDKDASGCLLDFFFEGCQLIPYG